MCPVHDHSGALDHARSGENALRVTFCRCFTPFCPPHSAPCLCAVANSGDSSSATAISAASIAASSGLNGVVVLSSNATAPAGYIAGGSLFRGSGFWASDAALPGARADHGLIVNNSTQEAFIMGGHDNRGNFLTT